MKNVFYILIAAFSLILHAKCVAQNNIVYGAGISYTNGVPTFVPPSKSARVAIDTVTSKWYEYATPGGWRWSGDRVQDISGCSAPAYVPGKAQSRLVLNACTEAQNGHGPELYKYTGTEWLCLNCVTGGGGVYTGGEGIVVDSPSIRIDTLDRVTFATSPTLPGGVGTIRWNDTDGTLEVGMKGGNVTQQIGQEQLTLVKHADNSGLANGAVVYVVGSDGASKTVRLARADAESTSSNTFGVMTEAATGGNKAFCTTFGFVRDLNTSSLTEGAMVWVSSATAGAMTTTRPTAPNHAVQVGFCIRSHATQGVIFVSVQNGYELGELHDVAISSPATGQALIYDTNKWVNGALPDASPTNELQTLSISNDTLLISDGNSVVLPGGSTKLELKYDNYRLPATYIKYPAFGLNANESVTNYPHTSLDNTNVSFSASSYGTSSTEYGGWLANGTSGDSVAISAPFWVIIGDSQAEGHPNEHGRLHVGGASSFTVNYQDAYGTPGYTLQRLTKMRWFNHGIGGQSTTQILARFRRDALGEIFDPGDGRGNRTLRRKPMGVVIIAGVNDIAGGATIAAISANLENMARQCRDNGIQAVFLNCPGDEIATQVFLRKVDSLNTYFASGALQSYGAAVVDYNRWWRDPTYNDNYHGQSLITDDIHPSRIGYDSLANFIFRSAKLPVLDSVSVYTKIGPAGFSGYSRPTSATIQGANYSFTGDVATLKFNTHLMWDSVWIKIVSSTNISGTSYSGFNHIVWHVRNDTSGIVTRKEPLYNGYNPGASYWQKSGSLLYPINTTDKVLIGATSMPTAQTQFYIKSPLNTGNDIFEIRNSANTTMLKVLDNGRVSINGNPLGGYPLSVNGAAIFGSGSNYTFMIGSVYQLYGSLPTFEYQSTAVNTGGSGFTQVGVYWNGSDLYHVPSATRGVNNTFSWRNIAGENVFRLSLADKTNSVLSQSIGQNYTTTGFIAQNTTAATSGVQQYSPAVRWKGNGYWTGGSTSREVEFSAQLITAAGASGPSGRLSFSSAINNAWTYDHLTISTDGRVKASKLINVSPITSLQKSAIVAEAGDIIFCSDCTANDSSTGVLQTYNGTTWKNHW